MKIVLAPDKFKGSLTALEFCSAVEEGILSVLPGAEIIKLPLADGGDGTIEVVAQYLKASQIKVTVNDPFFKLVKAFYLYDHFNHTAFVEMAEASGIKLLDPEDMDCKNATTFGTGELILDALNKGAKKIVIGLGGSATNDCGIGMAAALGYRFLDRENKTVKPIGANLSKIIAIDADRADTRLKQVKFRIACDVNNPLYGINGAAFVYAKQKGAGDADIQLLDKGLRDFSKLLDRHFKVRSQELKGAGAAGGLGLGTLLFLGGELTSGIDYIKELADFHAKIDGADWIITGEGKLDEQTLSGKTIKGVLNSAQKKGIPVAAFCGSIELSKEALREIGISHSDAILDSVSSVKDAFQNSYRHLTNMARVFAKVIR